jgi:hypothetical protein
MGCYQLRISIAMIIIPDYPFPARNKLNVDDIIFNYKNYKDEKYKENWYKNKTSNSALTYKLQYLNLEAELIKSFLFVHPSEKNAKTYSIKFSEIIKGSANLYELISKDLYAKFYLYDELNDRIDIKNYLSLDRFLNLANSEVIPYLIGDKFVIKQEIFKPFINLTSWDNNSSIKEEHKPNWWIAYNKIKHSNHGLEVYATLENAIASLAANFLLIDRIYGLGVVYGELFPPTGEVFNVKTSELFSIKH